MSLSSWNNFLFFVAQFLFPASLSLRASNGTLLIVSMSNSGHLKKDTFFLFFPKFFVRSLFLDSLWFKEKKRGGEKKHLVRK